MKLLDSHDVLECLNAESEELLATSKDAEEIDYLMKLRIGLLGRHAKILKQKVDAFNKKS